MHLAFQRERESWRKKENISENLWEGLVPRRTWVSCLPYRQPIPMIVGRAALYCAQCKVLHCVLWNRKFPNPSFTATPVIRKLNIFKYQTYVRAFSSHIHCAQCTHRLSKLIKGSSIPSITNTLIREDLIWKTYSKEKDLSQKMFLTLPTFGQAIAGKPDNYIYLTPWCQY